MGVVDFGRVFLEASWKYSEQNIGKEKKIRDEIHDGGVGGGWK